jgi:hypothetical protein
MRMIEVTSRRFPLILAGLLLVIVGIPATVVVATLRSARASQVESMLKLFVAWPYLGCSTALIVVLVLREPLRRLLERLVRWNSPFGEVGFVQQATPSSTVTPPETASVSLPPDKSIDATEPSGDASQSVKDRSSIKHMALAVEYSRRALQWEFYYLSHFLISMSKLTLQWVSSQPYVLFIDYDMTWRQAIPNPDQRLGIWNVLCSYRLIHDVLDRAEITAKGKVFLEFIEQNHAWANGVAAPPQLSAPVSVDEGVAR